MFKRILAIATMVCALPALANATKTDVTIWAQSAGGIITVTNALPNPVKLTSAYGQVFGSYSTAGGVAPSVTVTPNPGYNVASPLTTCTGSIATGATSSTVTCAEGQSVQAMFTYGPQAAVMTAAAGAGGHVNMMQLSNIFVGQKFVSAVNFKFTPSAGYSVSGITGVPAGAIVTPTPWAVNQVVSVMFPAGYLLTNVPVNLVASFGTTQAVANAGAPQTIIAPASTATLNGSASLNAVSYSWTQTSGPATATLATPTAASCAVSNMTALGTYFFKLTVNGSVYKTTSVTVSNSIAAAAATECVNCHDANGIGGGLAAGGVYANYTSSIHGQSTHALCAMCHVGANAAGHPGTVTKNSVDPATFIDKAAGVNGNQVAGQLMCNTCHSSTLTDKYAIPHAKTALGATCAGCHTGTNGSNGIGDAHSIKAPSNLSALPNTLCENCHSQATSGNATASIYNAYKASVHAGSDGDTGHSSCAACHSGSHDVTVHASTQNVDPVTFKTTTATVATSHGVLAQGAIFCTGCHNPIPHSTTFNAGFTCAGCHTSTNGTGGTGTPHDIKPLSCVKCHEVGQQQPIAGLVNDNNGVRAIMPEFRKRSHHILNGPGVDPTDEQCAVCHLEGHTGTYGFGVDNTKHMADGFVHLRNADTDAEILWSGTEHTNMDNFCFSCHDSNGCQSAVNGAVHAFLPTATAQNPFGDTLTNGYDQVQRAGVVDVKTAFTTTNASHHAVSGQRYQYRFSTNANAAAWAARTGNPLPAANQIAENDPNYVTGTFDASETFNGTEGNATLFEAGKFVAAYTPLGASASVGDNSTLHCGDCHTVGQWTNTNTTYNKAAIGAHGSNNEYLLRNNLGTDAIHNNLTYVCFNCHGSGSQLVAGATHPLTNKNQVQGYATSHSVSAFHIQCLADSADNIGVTNRLSMAWVGYQVKTLDYAPYAGTAVAPAAGSDGAVGNITGIACTNCHNSAIRSGFGGIHGGDNSYTDGFGRAQKSYRFMPGMGNYRYAPPGGWDGKDTTYVAPVGSADAGKPVGGCYTNSSLTGSDPNTGYSACSHHGTAAAPDPNNPNVLGGGTAGAPFTSTSAEYTIRDATAGNSLVTRPLKY